MPSRFATFQQFWPYYVSNHRTAGCRKAHFFGTSLGIVCVLAFIVTWTWWFIPLAFLVTYVPNGIGHFVFEQRNPPAFEYPLWSLAADLIMYGKMWAGEMDTEIAKSPY